MIGTIDASQRKAAKVAGIAFLFTFVIVIVANFAIDARLNVAGDAAATARNILTHETLFRTSIAFDLLYCSGLAVLLAALYVILRPVSRGLALLAAFSRLVYALMWVLMTLKSLDALRILKGAGYLQVFDAPRLQALAKLSLGERFDLYYVGLPFFALASTVCGYLWFKSGYIPKAFAAIGVIASAWCVLCAFAFIVFPDFNTVVNDWLFDTPMGLFELALGFWLLFRGLKE